VARAAVQASLAAALSPAAMASRRRAVAAWYSAALASKPARSDQISALALVEGTVSGPVPAGNMAGMAAAQRARPPDGKASCWVGAPASRPALIAPKVAADMANAA
jgi:hypothetical protein